MTVAKKVVYLKTLQQKLRQYRRQGKIIAFTNGCFDILHLGHVRYLEDAKKKNRILIVGLNSDASVKKIKGPGRPLNPQKARAEVLAALACVDFVTIFPEATPQKLIEAVCPDILIKGADWKGKTVAGADRVRKNGGRVEFVRYLPNYSTTGLMKLMKSRA